MITKTRKLRQDEINKNKKSAFEEGIIEWTRFYRANPHRFIIDYLGLPLFVFQMINLKIAYGGRHAHNFSFEQFVLSLHL